MKTILIKAILIISIWESPTDRGLENQILHSESNYYTMEECIKVKEEFEKDRVPRIEEGGFHVLVQCRKPSVTVDF